MEKRKRCGLQIRFNQESEQDIIEFFSRLKKPEVHITAISAFRMYMRSLGFYDKRWLESGLFSGEFQGQKRVISTNPTNSSKSGDEGLLDEIAFKTLNDMFADENELKN